MTTLLSKPVAPPDPGPGYRLLVRGEALHPGDEMWWESRLGWFYSFNAELGKPQSPNFYYRREV